MTNLEPPLDPLITEQFSARIAGAFGQAGVAWLGLLSQRLQEAADRWSIRLLPAFDPLSYHYVAPAETASGDAVVLKAGVPHEQFSRAIEALRHFDGEGAVRLLDADPDAGLMLMERLQPGEPLQSMKDDQQSTLIFAGACRRLKKTLPEGHRFPTVGDWAMGFARLRDTFDGKVGPFPETAVSRAERLFEELLQSMSDPIVLHGDLHHWNILSAQRERWLAVDAKGVVGEPEYEAGAWLRNPFPQILNTPSGNRLMARRIDILAAELGFDRDRMIGWAYSQAVLAGIWSFEEGLDEWKAWLACANLFVDLL